MSVKRSFFHLLLRTGVLLVLALTVGACSAIRFGGPDHDMSGTWQGSVTIQDQRIPGSLSVEQDGFILQAGFAAPDFDLNATGEGELDDDGDVRLDLVYNLECPGTAVLEGTLSDDDTLFTGSIEATDCTGAITGSFRFTR